jgi:hypothetical protein
MEDSPVQKVVEAIGKTIDARDATEAVLALGSSLAFVVVNNCEAVRAGETLCIPCQLALVTMLRVELQAALTDYHTKQRAAAESNAVDEVQAALNVQALKGVKS